MQLGEKEKEAIKTCLALGIELFHPVSQKSITLYKDGLYSVFDPDYDDEVKFYNDFEQAINDFNS